MSLEFTVEGPDGVETMGANDLAQAFQSQGYQSVSLAQDGQTMTVTDPQGGSAEINISEYLASKGKVTGMRPDSAMVNYDMVDNGARRGIAALGNHEDLKKLYLQAHLRDNDMGDAKVVGSGDDFYFFDPKSGKYHALTNKPGLDMADANEFGVDALENALGIGGSLAGGIGGGAAGSAVGPLGTIVGGAAGSAAGGAVGRGMFDMGAAALDPNLRKLIGSEEFQTGRVKQAGWDAVGGGLAGGLGAIAPKLLNTGIASSAAKGAGSAAEGVGGAVAGGAKYLNSDALIPKLVRAGAENFVPGTGQLQIPALLARSGELVPGGLKAGNRAANALYRKSFKGSEEGFAKASQSFGDAGFASPLVRADDVLTPWQEKLASFAEGTASRGFSTAPRASRADKLAAALSGQKPATNVLRESGVRDSINTLARGGRVEGAAKGVAEAAELASKGGRAVEAVNAGVIKGTIGTVGAAGRGLQATGRGLKNVGTIAAPLENRALIGQAVPWASEESLGAWGNMTRKPKSMRQRLGYE